MATVRGVSDGSHPAQTTESQATGMPESDAVALGFALSPVGQSGRCVVLVKRRVEFGSDLQRGSGSCTTAVSDVPKMVISKL